MWQSVVVAQLSNWFAQNLLAAAILMHQQLELQSLDARTAAMVGLGAF